MPGTGALTAAEPAVTGTMPPVTVTAPGEAVSLSDSSLVGPYSQPAWTKTRRFGTVRSYLLVSEGEIAFDHWWRARTYDDRKTRHKFTEEIAIGLPHRFQLDLYYDWTYENGEADHLDFAFEVRHAFADWGEIPLNPTLYLEYKVVDSDRGGDVIEPKILLAEQLSDKVYWAMNLVYERELSGELTNEYYVSQGFSCTVIDQVLSAGVEMKYVYEDTAETRGDGENKFLIGPSIQWKPTKNSHLDLVCLFGCTDDSPRTESYIVFGWKFGGGEDRYKPVSGRRN